MSMTLYVNNEKVSEVPRDAILGVSVSVGGRFSVLVDDEKVGEYDEMPQLVLYYPATTTGEFEWEAPIYVKRCRFLRWIDKLRELKNGKA